MRGNSFNNSINLFIFRSNARGMQYGIGTYINELTKALLNFPEICIFLVSYKSIDTKEFSTQKISERFSEVSIPVPLFPVTQNNSFDKKYAASVVRLISGIIPKNGQVVFQFNYIDDLSVILKIKEYFSFPVISMVHFAQWQQLFEGNRKKLSGLNIDKPSDNTEFTLSQEREMYRQSDHVVSVTGYMKDFLVNEYAIQPDKITVIHNGLHEEKDICISDEERAETRRNLGFGENDVIILFSGRIDPCKGVIFLMEAFERACKEIENLRLVLIGQGNIPDCQKKIQSSFGKITYTGFLPKETVTSFYKVADIGIAPSVYDHCPYTILEMMANRIPLIASRINGLDELLTDEECQFVNPATSAEGDIIFNINELSEAILRLAVDEKLRMKLAFNSYERFKKEFLSVRMANSMINLFHSFKENK